MIKSETYVEIEHDSLLTFVETDKPTYKPGQDVKIRILMLMHDLKPWQKSVRRLISFNIDRIVIILFYLKFIIYIFNFINFIL